MDKSKPLFYKRFNVYMRRIKLLGVSVALFAVGISITSCSKTDDPVDKGSDTVEVTDIKGANYSVVATSNVSVKYSIDAKATSDFAADGKKATFSNIESSSVMVTAEYTGVDADKYMNAKQTATVDFSSQTSSSSVDFTFVEKSDPVAQDIAIGGAPVVNNDQSVTVASITVPEGATVTGSTEGFAITAYKKTTGIVDTNDITVGDEFNNAGGYVLNCQPDGATFDKPVALKVFVGEGLAGYPLTLKNADDSVEGTVDADGNVSFEVNHFSDWILGLPFEVVDGPITSTDLLESITMNAVAGENTFSYTKKVGNDIQLLQGDEKKFQFVVDVAKGVFGDFVSTLKEGASFTSEGEGVANITVSQNKRSFTLRYNDIFDFTVTRYENIDYEITISGSTSSGHSGGSGR